MAKKRIQINDLYRLKLVSDPQISPDGQQVCFVREIMSKKDRKYYSTLWAVNNNGRNLHPLTGGKQQDRLPRWSPDGKRLAFVRQEDHKDQIWILPLTGGEALPLTQLKHGSISQLTWSPDGKNIAFLFHPQGKEVKRKKDGSAEIPVYRHITRLWFRLDGQGFFDSEYTHVWIADARTGKAKQLVQGNYDDAYPCWTPDNKEIVFVSSRFSNWEQRLEEQCIYRVPASGGDVTEIKTPEGPVEGLAVSPDGLWVAYLGHMEPYHSWGAVNYHLNVVSIDGKTHKEIGKTLDRTALSLTIGDVTPSFVVTSPVWSSDGTTVYYIVSSEGRQIIMGARISEGETFPVACEDGVAVFFSFSAARDALVFQKATLASPDEVYYASLSDPEKQITHLNRAYLNSRDFRVPEEIWFENMGQALQGWLVKPPDFDPENHYPLILNIHGGPRGQYGRTFFHEMLVLAANGYVVLYTNPRGSQGYGMEFAHAITARWAEPAMGDLMAGVDYVLAQGSVDEKRMGVTGGSYGGYMTNWIVTHSNRFAAAVTQRSVSDLSSMFGNSDIGWDLNYEFGGAPWEKRDTYTKWSPITYIRDCHTPLLVIHSENDLRCNVEQGDQMYTALKFLQRDVEYVRFPEEPHGLSRHGRPDRREARLQFMLKWFDKYLK
ncbi:MAG: prolyl oligopeptidase family serine peptidase [Fidelibacterota bacterium]